MSSNSSISIDILKEFERVCENAARVVRQAGSMRDAMEAADVTEPHVLRGIGRTLPSYRRILKALGDRLDELLATQLEAASRIREPYGLERELDRLKVHEWYVLRSEYPELYSKGIAEAADLQRRLQQQRRKRKPRAGGPWLLRERWKRYPIIAIERPHIVVARGVAAAGAG